MIARIGRCRAALLAVALLAGAVDQLAAQGPAGLDIPVDYRTLPNGLRVVVSRDTTVPTVAIAVYYNTGFRLEPKGRTGFAHLFEHLMFQGSRNLGKMEFIKLVEKNGGILNGSTRFDFTNYFEVVPAHTLRPMLWAEADRMRGLAIDSSNLANQQGVVKNEVRVNVLNAPYGGFPWLDMPQLANVNWSNAHNFYGDLAELDAATLEDAEQFFRTYYAPSNAVLVIVGDVEPTQTWAWINEYFASIPSQPRPTLPDVTEPRQEQEKRGSRTDALAQRPAIGIAYHVPKRGTPEWYAFGLIDQIIGQGRDAQLFDELVRKRAATGGIQAGINFGLGNMFNVNGPILWIMQAIHDGAVTPDSIIGGVDKVVAGLQAAPVDAATLERARTKLRSSLYSYVEQLNGFGKADLLASYALFEDDPAAVNRIEAGFAAVTPELIQRVAQEYLRPGNRSIFTIVPGAAAPKAGGTE